MNKDPVKIIIITLIAVFIRIICTPIFGGDPISITQPFGSLTGIIGIIPSVIIMFIIAYLHLTLIGFYCIRNMISGNYRIGFLFGFIIGLIWLFGMFEAGIIKNISQYKEFIFGVSESIPIIILGLLIAYSLRKEKTPFANNRTKQFSLSHINKLKIVFIISFTYLIFRYISYSFIHIESQFINKPISTLLWTFGNGILISVLFIFIRSLVSTKNIIRTVVVFGVVIFGIDWFIYNMFVPVFFNVSVHELIKSFIVRSLLDIISVCISVYISEVFINKKNYLTTAST